MSGYSQKCLNGRASLAVATQLVTIANICSTVFKQSTSSDNVTALRIMKQVVLVSRVIMEWDAEEHSDSKSDIRVSSITDIICVDGEYYTVRYNRTDEQVHGPHLLWDEQVEECIKNQKRKVKKLQISTYEIDPAILEGTEKVSNINREGL